MRKDNKLEIKFDLETLDLFCLFVSQISKEVTKADLTEMESFLSMIKEEIYKNDINLYARFLFIRYVLKARLEEKLTNKNIILDYCKNNMSDLTLDVLVDQIIPTIESSDLTDDDILYIKGIINNNLKFYYIYKYRDTINDLSTLLSGDSFINIRDINDKFENLVVSGSREVLTVSMSNSQQQEFNLFDKINRDAQIGNVIEEKRKPEAMLKTGYQYLNKMLGGGFRKKRVYGFFGITGGFKSGLLINLLRSVKVNNNYDSPNSLVPTILYITQENSVDESIERVFSCITGEEISNFETSEVTEMFADSGLDKKTSNINIIMKFVPAKSATTNIFRELYNKYRDMGYDIIAIFHDYVKTMRPVQNNSEVRYQMSNIISEMKVIATELNITLITVAQLNREAARTIDSSVGSSKADITRMIGKSNIGESWGMIEEFDWAAVINKEFHDVLNQEFLVIKNVKARYLKTVLGYFAQPFDTERSFYLMEDIDLEKPLALLTMKASINDLDENQINGGKRKSAIERKELDDQKKYEEETESTFSKFVSL